MKKLLVIQTAFIGDVILATPIVEKLHQHYPDAKIDFLLRKGNEALLDNHPYIHRVLIWNKKKNKYKHFLHLLKQIRNEKYDAVVNLQRFAATGMLTAFSKATHRIGFNKNPFSFLFTHKTQHEINNGKHEVERNLQLIEVLTDSNKQSPLLYPSKEDFQKVAHYKVHKYLCIAPASVWFTKQFPKEKWMELIQQLPKENTIYLLGGKEDKEQCDEMLRKTNRDRLFNLAGELSFLQTAALMKDASMNYVNDSAPLHIASAMNAPTTAVFCSTLPAFGFGPLAENAKVIETKEKLQCRPCGLHGKKTCPQSHFKCATTIDISEML